MALRLIATHSTHSEYLDTHTLDVVRLAHGRGQVVRLLPIDELDVSRILRLECQRVGYWQVRRTFAAVLARHTWETSGLSYRISWCDACSDPIDTDTEDAHGVAGGGVVCDSCIGDYSWCDSCSEYAAETTYLDVRGESLCDSCLEDVPTCEECGEYLEDQYASRCDNCRSCSCEPARPVFALGTLSSDTLRTITTAAGVITEEGMQDLERIVYAFAFYAEPCAHGVAPDVFGDVACAKCSDLATVRDGVRQAYYSNLVYQVGTDYRADGRTWSKRFAAECWKRHAVKLPADLVARLGSAAATHSAGQTVSVSVSRRDLVTNDPSDWGHAGSCWWGSYAASLCTLKGYGGVGVRTWSNGRVSGRVWALPLDSEGEPITTGATPSAWLVFNGYGALSGVHMARTVAALLEGETTYAKVGFSVPDHVMYVNGQTGYLVGAPDVLAQLGDYVSPDLVVPC